MVGLHAVDQPIGGRKTPVGMNLRRKLLTSLGILLFVQGITGDHHAKCPTEPIEAVRGDTVTLQCRLDPQENVVDSTVDWKHVDFDEVVHSYRHNRDHLHLQAERFRGRTALDHDHLSGGINTLNISSVQPSDSGSYRCFFQKWTASCTITLHVVDKDQQDKRKGDTTSTTRLPPDNMTKPENSDGENRRGHGGVIFPVVLMVCLLMGLGLKSMPIGNYVKRFSGRKGQQPETPLEGSNHLENIV